MANSRPVPDAQVYGEDRVYVCRCYTAHGVVHVCGLCDAVQVSKPVEPWVPAERCYTCLSDVEARMRADLAVIEARLKRAVHARDGVTGETIPPRHLTRKGWEA